MQSNVFSFEEGQKDRNMDHSHLTQKKRTAKFTPLNETVPHNWSDMMQRTFAANSFLNQPNQEKFSNKARETKTVKEALCSTKQILEPDLQPEVNNLNNTITGTRKYRPPIMNSNTFVFETLTDFNRPVTA